MKRLWTIWKFAIGSFSDEQTEEYDNVVAVALRGRVPCKVYGPVRKGDVLIASSHPGFAEAAPFRGYQTPAVSVVGKAISEYSGLGEGQVEILV